MPHGYHSLITSVESKFYLENDGHKKFTSLKFDKHVRCDLPFLSLPPSNTCSSNTTNRCTTPSICEHGIRALWLCLVLRRSQLSLSHMKTCTSEDKPMKHPSRLRFVNFTLQLKRTWVASQSSQKQITQKPTGLSRRVKASRSAKKRSGQKRNGDATKSQENGKPAECKVVVLRKHRDNSTADCP